jgi:hypothetical protein
MFAGFLEWFVVHFLAIIFPSRYRVIPRKEDGEPLLRQFRLWGSPSLGSGAYLQSFLTNELASEFHNHRWPEMRSRVLTGFFVEERYPGGTFIVRKAGNGYTMDGTVIHRLAAVAPRTWTFFRTKGPIREWGYFKRPQTVVYNPSDKAIPAERKLPPL